TLASLAGLTFTTGDGTADVTMVFTGTVASINAALAGVTFAPTADVNGSAAMPVSSDDLGHTGTGGAPADPDTINATVNAVNDAPVHSVPAAQSTNDDTTLVFSAANGNAISLADLDVNEGTGLVRVTLTATNGALTLSGLGGLSFTVG